MYQADQEERQIKLHQRALEYIAVIRHINMSKNDILRKIEIEDNKPGINSYLLTPRWWYEKRLQTLLELDKFCVNRYMKVIHEIQMNCTV